MPVVVGLDTQASFCCAASPLARHRFFYAMAGTAEHYDVAVVDQTVDHSGNGLVGKVDIFSAIRMPRKYFRLRKTLYGMADLHNK